MKFKHLLMAMAVTSAGGENDQSNTTSSEGIPLEDLFASCMDSLNAYASSSSSNSDVPVPLCAWVMDGGILTLDFNSVADSK